MEALARAVAVADDSDKVGTGPGAGANQDMNMDVDKPITTVTVPTATNSTGILMRSTSNSNSVEMIGSNPNPNSNQNNQNLIQSQLYDHPGKMSVPPSTSASSLSVTQTQLRLKMLKDLRGRIQIMRGLPAQMQSLLLRSQAQVQSQLHDSLLGQNSNPDPNPNPTIPNPNSQAPNPNSTLSANANAKINVNIIFHTISEIGAYLKRDDVQDALRSANASASKSCNSASSNITSQSQGRSDGNGGDMFVLDWGNGIGTGTSKVVVGDTGIGIGSTESTGIGKRRKADDNGNTSTVPSTRRHNVPDLSSSSSDESNLHQYPLEGIHEHGNKRVTKSVFPALREEETRYSKLKAGDIPAYIRYFNNKKNDNNTGNNNNNNITKIYIWAAKRDKNAINIPLEQKLRMQDRIILRITIRDVLVTFVKLSVSTSGGGVFVESVTAFGPREKAGPFGHSEFIVYEKVEQEIMGMVESEPRVMLPQLVDLISSYKDMFIGRCGVCGRILSLEGHIPAVGRIWRDRKKEKSQEGYWEARHISCRN